MALRTLARCLLIVCAVIGSERSMLAQSAAPITGIADTHTHMFSNLGFGGIVVWGDALPAGTGHALPSCEPLHGWNGGADYPGMFTGQGLLHGNFGADPGGDSDFTGWPRWNTFTHQQMHIDWLRRAFDGGVKLIVVHAVNNEALCAAVKQLRGFPEELSCNDMDMVDRQIQAARAAEASVDWFRIARSASEARQIINSGGLAVVLGIEVDTLFNCGPDYRPGAQCTADDVKRELKKYYDLGVRHIHPIHLFDNGFGGAAIFDDILNAGNKAVNGQYFATRECSSEYSFKLAGLSGLALWVAETLGLDLPEDSGHAADCNSRGLTPLGHSLLNKMMSRKMIIDVDHMSALAMDQAFAKFQPIGYPVISGHTGFVDTSNGSKRHEAQKTGWQVDRIRDLGGFVSPLTHQGNKDQIVQYNTLIPNDCSNSSKTFAQAYSYAVDKMQGGAVGLATDWNGFAGQPGPRFGWDKCNGDLFPPTQSGGVSYPFTPLGTSISLGRSAIGPRMFNFNDDGLAHVGLVPDFVEDVRSLMPSAAMNPLLRSAEAYIRMWEIAESKNPFPPTVGMTSTPAPIVDGWHNADVTFTVTGGENSSGDGWPVQWVEYSAMGAQVIAPTTVSGPTASIVVTTDGQTTVRALARDEMGSPSTEVTNSVKIDKTAPAIAISSPLAAEYTLNEPVVATYSCTDTGSGLATCTGTVASGLPIDTATIGPHRVSVNSTDRVGNASAGHVSYDVGYRICLAYDPTRVRPAGSIVPLRVRICDYANTNLSSAAIVLTATALTLESSDTSGTLDDAGSANPDNNFRFDGSTNTYVYNLKTTGLASGRYRLAFTVSGDPTPHTVVFQVK